MRAAAPNGDANLARWCHSFTGSLESSIHSSPIPHIAKHNLNRVRSRLVIVAIAVAVAGFGVTSPDVASAATKKKTTAKRTTKKPTTKRTPTTQAPTTVAPAPVESTLVPASPTALGSPLPNPATSPATNAATNPATNAAPKLGIAPASFAPCAEVECAEVLVPRSYADPNGERIALFVSRRKARVPESRIGTLFLNPGGPGGPTFDLVRAASALVSPTVLDRFDLIGVDPRGTERSTPLKCDAPRQSIDQRLLDETPIEARTARRTYSAIAQRCRDAEGTRLDYMDTETAARDLDAVRESLNEETISYLGISYGTYLGAVYATLFPARTRSAILDSAIDPNHFGTSIVVDRFQATERALDTFLAACSDGRLKPCNFNDGTNLTEKYRLLRERMTQAGPALEVQFDNIISSLIGFPRNGWPILGRAMQELWATGRWNTRQLSTDNQSTREPSTIQPFDTFSNTTNIAVNCRDGIIPRDLGSYQRVRTDIAVVAPRFASLTSDALVTITCLDWASPIATQVPLRPSASVMVIGNTLDLTTPLLWSEGLAATMGAPLVVREGGGHGAVDKSACVRDIVARFLVDSQRPADRTTCAELVWQ